MTGLDPLWMPVIGVGYALLFWISHRWPRAYLWALSAGAIALVAYVAWIETGKWALLIAPTVAVIQVLATRQLIKEMRR